jgi:hypothetical protein
MAQGHSSGISHTIDLYSQFTISEHFSASANYRGEIIQSELSGRNDWGVHTVSVEVRAML